MDRIGKAFCLTEIGLARLPPQEIGVGRIGEAACDRVFDAEPGRMQKKPSAVRSPLMNGRSRSSTSLVNN